MPYKYDTEAAVRREEESKIYLQNATSLFRSKNVSTLKSMIRKKDGSRIKILKNNLKKEFN